MIVRYEADGSLVMITQNDHAQAAGFCASHWGNARFARPQPQESAVRAAFLHDLAWLREETRPLFNPETRRTLNYLDVPSDDRADEHQWAIDWIARADRYAGLLVSKHRTGIWKSRYGLMESPRYPIRKLTPAIEALVARAHAEQESMAASFDPQEVLVNYILLQIWDLFSLYICSTERLQPTSYKPVPTGYAKESGVGMTLTPVAPTRISVDPYPFDQPSLDVSVVYRRLDSEFGDEEEFRKAFLDTPPQVATFTFFDPADAH